MLFLFQLEGIKGDKVTSDLRQVNAQYLVVAQCSEHLFGGVTKIQCNMSLGGPNPLIMTIDIKAPSVAGERCRVTEPGEVWM